MEAALVFDNPHTQYTMEALRASWSQLMAAVQRAINEMENQILIRDSKGLTEEQLQEYRKSFDHFDRVSMDLWVRGGHYLGRACAAPNRCETGS